MVIKDVENGNMGDSKLLTVSSIWLEPTKKLVTATIMAIKGKSEKTAQNARLEAASAVRQAVNWARAF